MTTDTLRAMLVTDEHLLVGEVPTHGQRLLENLIDPTSAFLHIHQVHICRRAAASESVQVLEHAVVVKKMLSLAVLSGKKHEAPNVHRLAIVEKRSSSAFLIVPGFEVRGEMHCRGLSDPVAILSSETGSFIPVTRATVSWGCGKPLAAGVVLVNKAYISLLQVGETRKADLATNASQRLQVLGGQPREN